MMDRSNKPNKDSKEDSWAKDQEKGYWKDVNKNHDERIAINYLQGLDAKGIVDAIAAAKFSEDIGLYTDSVLPALALESAKNAFLLEVGKCTAALLIQKGT
jgi:hypothetical protein